MTALFLGAFAIVIWIQHRNHQADYTALITILTAMSEEEEAQEPCHWPKD